MKAFVIIETADIEIIGVHVRSNREIADRLFDLIAEENLAHEWDQGDMQAEIPGTLRGAGDDAYAVQMIEKEVE